MIRKFTSLLLIFFPVLLMGQTDLYDIHTIQDISITFTQPNWDYMMDTAATGAEGYIIASQVVINGVVFDSVGVKYKGNSSYNPNNNKNPLHIALDYVHGNASYQGYTDIKMSNGFKDPSFVREALSYEILNKYMHAPQSNYARVRINGAYYGLMVSSESINKKFVGDHFYSSNGSFFKCNPVTPGPGGGPSLSYLGSDSTLYQGKYELKSTYGWNDLVNLIDSLNNLPSSIINLLDVDRALWMLAFNNVFVNLDSYTGGVSQNYYLYRDANSRFNTVVWDLNESFGAFTNSGTGNLNLTQEQQMSPLIHETNNAKPLISKLMGNPEYKRRYLAHMRTILNENFVNTDYINRVQDMQALIDSSVQADVNKFYTYTQFQNSLTTSVTGGMGLIPGIELLMAARTSWLFTQPQFTAVPPTISNISLAPSSPSIGTSPAITCQVINGNTVRLGFRDAAWKKFNYVQMIDDGLHGDGSAGDGVYGAYFPVTSALMDYYVYAENVNAGIFSPERAEHEFYQLIVSLPTAAAGEVTLNEFMASNQNDTTDSNGSHEDWIELYNNTSSQLNLFGLYLSDDASNLSKWPFPEGTTVGPYGYVFVWADEDNNPNELHCNFKLAAGGEELYLSNSSGTIYDYYIFGSQSPDISLARCPNGIGPWAPNLNTTPAYENACVTGISESDIITSGIQLFPNPANVNVTFRSLNKIQSLSIFDATGNSVMEISGLNEAETTLDVGNLAPGVYLARVNGTQNIKLIVRP